jgi:hypothetical protein
LKRCPWPEQSGLNAFLIVRPQEIRLRHAWLAPFSSMNSSSSLRNSRMRPSATWLRSRTYDFAVTAASRFRTDEDRQPRDCPGCRVSDHRPTSCANITVVLSPSRRGNLWITRWTDVRRGQHSDGSAQLPRSEAPIVFDCPSTTFSDESPGYIVKSALIHPGAEYVDDRPQPAASQLLNPPEIAPGRQ